MKLSSRFVVQALSLLIILSVLLTGLPAQFALADTNYALQFDGSNDYVRLAQTASIFGPGWESTKSVELWVRPEGTSPTCQYPDPVWCDAVFGDRPRWWGISRGVINGLDRLWVWNWDTNGMDAIAMEYTPDEWVHIALVHSDGLLRAYKNGIEVGSIPSGPTQQPSTGALPFLHIGGVINNAARNWTFQGQIDEVRLWNVARSASDLAAFRTQELTGTESGLVAYYKMSDGSGLTLTDESLNAWDGTLHDGYGVVPPDGQYPLWVISTAFEIPSSTPTFTPEVSTDTPTPTNLPTDTPTPTIPVDPPTATPTYTLEPPTNTPLPPTETPTPTSTVDLPTATPTFTEEPPTVTPTPTIPVDPPTATPTFTEQPPTHTPLPPTETPAPTNTPLPPTATQTPTDTPAPTNTPLPPTATQTPTETPIPPTSTPTLPPGSAGYALQFDGSNDFVHLAETAYIFGPGWENTKTVEFWIRPEGPAPTCLYANPAWCDAVFGDRPRWWGVSRGVINGIDNIYIWNYDGTGMDSIAMEYTPDEWVHIALVHSDGVLRAFKNGVEYGSRASGPTQQPSTGALPVLQLGGVINNAARNWTFQGQIDEVRLWNVARSTSDLAAFRTQELTGAEAGLVAYYKMSDGSGLSLTDDSLNAWDGTLLDGGGRVPADGQYPLWVVSGAFSQ